MDNLSRQDINDLESRMYSLTHHSMNASNESRPTNNNSRHNANAIWDHPPNFNTNPNPNVNRNRYWTLNNRPQQQAIIAPRSRFVHPSTSYHSNARLNNVLGFTKPRAPNQLPNNFNNIPPAYRAYSPIVGVTQSNVPNNRSNNQRKKNRSRIRKLNQNQIPGIVWNAQNGAIISNMPAPSNINKRVQNRNDNNQPATVITPFSTRPKAQRRSDRRKEMLNKINLKKKKSEQAKEKQKSIVIKNVQVRSKSPILIQDEVEDDEVVEIPMPPPVVVEIDDSSEDEQSNDGTCATITDDGVKLSKSLEMSIKQSVLRCPSPSESTMSDDFITQRDRNRLNDSLDNLNKILEEEKTNRLYNQQQRQSTKRVSNSVELANTVTTNTLPSADVYETESSDMLESVYEKGSRNIITNPYANRRRVLKRKSSGSNKDATSTDEDDLNPPEISKPSTVQNKNSIRIKRKKFASENQSDEELTTIIGRIVHGSGDSSIEAEDETISARDIAENALKRMNESVAVESENKVNEEQVTNVPESVEQPNESQSFLEDDDDDVILQVNLDETNANQELNDSSANLVYDESYYLLKDESEIGWNAEMKYFYHGKWGEEDFNVARLRAQMPRSNDIWKISSEDKRPKFVRRLHIRCGRCNEIGHKAQNCRAPPKKIVCFMCGKEGHREPRCPEKICLKCGTPAKVFGRTCRKCAQFDQFFCRLCNVKGHKADKCPDLWRRYHSTVLPNSDINEDIVENNRKFCCICAGKGHRADTCKHALRILQYPAPKSAITSHEPIYGQSSIRNQEPMYILFSDIRKNPKFSYGDVDMEGESTIYGRFKAIYNETHISEVDESDKDEEVEENVSLPNMDNEIENGDESYLIIDDKYNITEPEKDFESTDNSSRVELDKSDSNTDLINETIEEVENKSEIQRIETELETLPVELSKEPEVTELENNKNSQESESFEPVTILDFIPINCSATAENSMISTTDYKKLPFDENIICFPNIYSEIEQFVAEQIRELLNDLGNVQTHYSALVKLKGNSEKNAGKIQKHRRALNMILFGQAGLREGPFHLGSLQMKLKDIHIKSMEADNRKGTIMEDAKEELFSHFAYIFSSIDHSGYESLVKEYENLSSIPKPDIDLFIIGLSFDLLLTNIDLNEIESSTDSTITTARVYLSQVNTNYLESIEGKYFIQVFKILCGVKIEMEHHQIGPVLHITGTTAAQNVFHQILVNYFTRQENTASSLKNSLFSRQAGKLYRFIIDRLQLLRVNYGSARAIYNELMNCSVTKKGKKRADKLTRTLNIILFGQAGLKDGKKNLRELQNYLNLLKNKPPNSVIPEEMRSSMYNCFSYIFVGNSSHEYEEIIDEYDRLKKNNKLPKPELDPTLVGLSIKTK